MRVRFAGELRIATLAAERASANLTNVDDEEQQWQPHGWLAARRSSGRERGSPPFRVRGYQSDSAKCTCVDVAPIPCLFVGVLAPSRARSRALERRRRHSTSGAAGRLMVVLDGGGGGAPARALCVPPAMLPIRRRRRRRRVGRGKGGGGGGCFGGGGGGGEYSHCCSQAANAKRMDADVARTARRNLGAPGARPLESQVGAHSFASLAPAHGAILFLSSSSSSFLSGFCFRSCSCFSSCPRRPAGKLASLLVRPSQSVLAAAAAGKQVTACRGGQRGGGGGTRIREPRRAESD